MEEWCCLFVVFSFPPLSIFFNSGEENICRNRPSESSVCVREGGKRGNTIDFLVFLSILCGVFNRFWLKLHVDVRIRRDSAMIGDCWQLNCCKEKKNVICILHTSKNREKRMMNLEAVHVFSAVAKQMNCDINRHWRHSESSCYRVSGMNWLAFIVIMIELFPGSGDR